MQGALREDWQPYEADIAVYDPTGTKTVLLVEVKRSVSDDEAESTRLREYMLEVSCHNGLLVTPEWIFVYRDTFESSNLDAIRRVGKLSTERILQPFAEGLSLNDEQQLTRVVVRWLQELSKNWYDWLASLPGQDDIIDALLPGFVTAVAQGRVVSETEM